VSQPLAVSTVDVEPGRGRIAFHLCEEQLGATLRDHVRVVSIVRADIPTTLDQGRTNAASTSASFMRPIVLQPDTNRDPLSTGHRLACAATED